jgi:hypothetical protein
VNTTLIPAGVTSANKHLYQTDVLKEALKKMPREMIGTLGYKDEGYRPSLADAAFVAKGFALNERGDLVCELSLLDTPDGHKLQEMLESGSVAFCTKGQGEVGDDNLVTNFTVTDLAAVSKTDDAFEIPYSAPKKGS